MFQWYRVYATVRTWGGRLAWLKVRVSYTTEQDAMDWAMSYADRTGCDQLKIARVYARS